MSAHRTVSRRELLNYSFLAALTVAVSLICAGAIWFAQPREPIISLGHVSEFPPWIRHLVGCGASVRSDRLGCAECRKRL